MCAKEPFQRLMKGWLTTAMPRSRRANHAPRPPWCISVTSLPHPSHAHQAFRVHVVCVVREASMAKLLRLSGPSPVTFHLQDRGCD